MKLEHKIGIGITCTFLCLVGAIIGLKMKDTPASKEVGKVAPDSAGKPEETPNPRNKGSVNLDDPFGDPVLGKLTPTNEGKRQTLPTGPQPFDPAKVNTGQSNGINAAKNTPTPNAPSSNRTGIGSLSSTLTSSQPRVSTSGDKANEQRAGEKSNDKQPTQGYVSSPSIAPIGSNQSSTRTSTTTSQPRPGVGPLDTAPSPSTRQEVQNENSTVAFVENPENRFTKERSVPMMPDMPPEFGKTPVATASPATPAGNGPTLFAPSQGSSPPPAAPASPPAPPSPIPLIGSSTTVAPLVKQTATSTPALINSNGSPQTSKPATPAPVPAPWPPTVSKADNNNAAPPSPASPPPAPSRPAAGPERSPNGSYFVPDPQSSASPAGSTHSGALVPVPDGGASRSERLQATAPGSASAGPAPQVTVYDEVDYVCQAGDTFKKISADFYQDDSYAEALKRHNQHHPRASEQMAKFGTITAGEKIAVPPADILKQRYGDAIARPTVPASPMMPVSHTAPASPPAPQPPGGLLPPPGP